ncbi:hypothetical protein C9J19_19190 [Photobacterium phosphoreum]|uniref:hypothetical protein n=1 Tax=Photobacterium phosphoreum TaxID=659 RepID=UPI000D16A955|nr:hypothetical protein [Photobacterium phosphoreum]PSW25193.1 hypothetical protein C9J19_19190 [Photobacterium phosphoreum]
MAKTLDLTNTASQQCDVFNSDGIISGPCEPKTFTDVLYIPQLQKWFYISENDANELKKQADELDNTVKAITDKLYSRSSQVDEKKSKETIQKEVLEKLNQKSILENYKIRSFTYFLSDQDKSEYVNHLYTKELIQTYARIIKNTSKIPQLKKVAEVSQLTIESYRQQLGLTHSDLTEGSIVQSSIQGIERIIELRNSTRIGNYTQKDLIRFLNTYVIAPLNDHIKDYEKKAKKQAEKDGFTWYKSQFTDKYHFVKSEETLVESSYTKYKNLIDKFNKEYEEQNNLLEYYENYKKVKQDVANSIISASLYTTLELLNSLGVIDSFFASLEILNAQGIVVPEQVLSKEQLFCYDKETKDTFTALLEKLKGKPDLNDLEKTGRWLGTDLNIKDLRFNSSEPKKLNHISQQNIIYFIEKLGYYNCLVFSNALDKALTADIQEYITDILANKATALNYGMGCINILVAIRYQIDYMKYCANQNLKQEKVNFCLNKAKSKQSVLALDTITWTQKDIKLTEYKFAWKESDTHIVEFFIMSEENKPRYMISSNLNKLLISHGLVTELNLKDNIDVASGVKNEDIKQANTVTSLQKGIKQAIKSARDSAKNNQTKKTNLNSAVPDNSIDKFAKYTSLIQLSQTMAGGEGLSYIVNAQAELFRFCADNCRFETNYPTSFEDLAKRVIKKTTIASINASANIDILSGHMTVKQMLPSRNGFSMVISTRFGEQNKTRELYLGQLRSDTEMVLYGSVGIGLSLSAAVLMSSTDGGISLSPILPADTNLPNTGYIEGSVDLFAGARTGITVSSDVRWCKPSKNMQGIITNPLNKSWITQLTPEQANNLRTTNRLQIREDRDWHQIGRFCRTTEKSFGIGLHGTLKFGYRNNEFILTTGGGITVGGGGYLEQTIALYPESVLEFVNAFVDLLATNDFRRLDIFTEHNDDDGTLDGNQVLNTLITMTMVTGLNVSQLALLNMNEVIKQEKDILLCKHADMIAISVMDFFKNNKDKQNLKPWFHGMPPESRAKLLYALTSESPNLTDILAQKIRDVRRYETAPFGTTKLTDKENTQLKLGLSEESKRWSAVANLLSFWINDNFIYRSIEDRQIEETFTRFNPQGQTMMVADYGNKLVPYIVWEKLKNFLDRSNTFFTSSDIYPISETDIRNINRTINRFNDYFSSDPENRYEKVVKLLDGEKLSFIVYNGNFNAIRNPPTNNISLSLWKLGYYYIARSKVFPKEYKKSSLKKLAKEKLNSILESITAQKDTIGKIENAKEIKDAIKQHDMSKLLELLGNI